MSEQICDNCRFFAQESRVGANADCRRYAPGLEQFPVTSGDGKRNWNESRKVWPKPAYKDWCGAWEPKEQIQKQPQPDDRDQNGFFPTCHLRWGIAADAARPGGPLDGLAGEMIELEQRWDNADGRQEWRLVEEDL